jgi:hypothetical protein
MSVDAQRADATRAVTGRRIFQADAAREIAYRRAHGAARVAKSLEARVVDDTRSVVRRQRRELK